MTRGPSQVVSRTANDGEGRPEPITRQWPVSAGALLTDRGLVADHAATAALPVSWTICAYQCPGAPRGFQAVAHLFEERNGGVDGGVFKFQSATAFGQTKDEASARLTAFLQAEIGRAAKRQANANAFGDRVRLQGGKTA